MEIKKNFIVIVALSILLFTVSLGHAATENKETSPASLNQELFNLVSTAASIDLKKITDCLEKGADPNYFSYENNEGNNSVLSDYVFFSIAAIKYGSSVGAKIITEEDGNEVLKLFFEKGAKIRSADYRLIASSIDETNLYLQTLLSNGLNPNLVVEGATQIERAIKAHNDKAVQILKEYGVNPSSEAEILKLIFFQAAFEDDIESMRLCIKKGVDINAKDPDGQTVLIHALKFGIFTDERTRAITFLLKNGADVNRRAEAGTYTHGETSPLHVAVFWSSLPLKLEREGGIKNPKMKNAPQNSKNILKALVKKGAYVSGHDVNGKTPLHVAAETNNLYAAELLIKSGSKISGMDNKGRTALDYAESAEMIALLTGKSRSNLLGFLFSGLFGWSIGQN